MFSSTKSDRRLTKYEFDMVNLNKMAYKLPEQRTNYNDYKYISWISNTEYAIFENGNFIFFVIKGTNNIDNLLTDAALILNITDKTFKNDEEKYLQIKQTYPGKTIRITGHSLGGTKTLTLAKKYKLRGTTFNTFIPKITYKFIELINETPNVDKFVNKDDILSNNALSINRKNIIMLVNKWYKSNLYKVHSLNCYIEDCFKY